METKETSTTALQSITDSSQARTAEHYFTAWTRTAHLVRKQRPKETTPVIPSRAEGKNQCLKSATAEGEEPQVKGIRESEAGEPLPIAIPR